MAHWFNDDLSALRAAQELSNADLAKFHYYNANGIVREWRGLGDRLLAFGRGYLAYGDTGFYEKELRRLADLKRVDPIRLQTTLSGIRRTIEKGNAFLTENNQPGC